MLKYLLLIIIIITILYFLSILKQKWYTENFDNGVKINVLGASALERVVDTIFDKPENKLDVDVNNNLGKDQILVQDISHETYKKKTFPDTCPINLHCSNPPTKNEQVILDVYRNNLNRDPDRLGFHYWMGRIKKGDSIASITQAFKDSPEYKQVLEGRDEAKFDDINNLKANPTVKPVTKNECAISYGEENAIMIDNKKTSVAKKYICPIEKPLCLNYTPNVKWGTCNVNGNNEGNNAVVLGSYNMHPWNVNDTWLDKFAKWIWFEDNADRIAMPSSTITFYYKYYKESDTDDNIEIHIACDKYAEVYLNNKHIVSQVGGFPKAGIHQGITPIKMKQGINIFEVNVVNEGIVPNPAGLLMSVIGTNKGEPNEPLIHTDEKWSYYHSLPKPTSILFKFRKQTYSTIPEIFNPLVALWNKKHKGFLKLDVDESVDKYNANGKITLNNKLSEKYLTDSYDVENCIFKVARTEQWSKENTYSLFNCKNSRYVRTNKKDWSIDSGILNADQNLIEDLNEERWIIVYNNDFTVSFQSAIWKNRYLTVYDKDTIVAKEVEIPDEDSKWEILNIDTIFFNNSDTLIANTNNKLGFVLKIPKSVGYIGNFPINPQNLSNHKLLWNNTFMTYNIQNETSEWNTTTIFRTDFIEEDIGWKQHLQLMGVNKKFLKKIQPEFELLSTGSTKQLLITNDKLICYATNNTPYIRELNNTYTDSDLWKLFDNSSYGTNLIVGSIENEHYLFSIGLGEYSYVYYRPLNSVMNGGWLQYNNVVKNLIQIRFDKESKQIIGLLNTGELYRISSRTTQEKIVMPNKFVDFNILNTNVGTTLLLMDRDGKLYSSKLNNNLADKPELLASNIYVYKIDSINNILFAINKTDGKIYFKPISIKVPFRLYSSSLEGNLIDICIYKTMIYAVSSKNEVLRCPIVIN